jgi:hypothetical protein
MQYSNIPKTKKIIPPVYSNIQTCPKCQSTNSYPIMNIIGSPRYCNKCTTTFKAQLLKS